MMRKLTFFFALLCCLVPQLRADVIQPSTTLPTEGLPEHVYKMTSGNSLILGMKTSPTQTAANYAYLAFYEVEGKSDAYYIYDTTSRKWFTYDNSGIGNKRDFIALNSEQETADYFSFRTCSNFAGYYDIRPVDANGSVGSKYLNWNGGLDYNAYDGNTTLGLWQDNGNTDGGSRWIFEEVENPCFFIGNGRGYWTVDSNGNMSWAGSKDINDDNQKFGFVQYKGNTYLYNVGTQKFINKDKSTSARYNDPVFFISGDNIEANTLITYFDNAHFINIGGQSNLVIDGWGPGGTNANGCADAGNCNRFYVAGSFEVAEEEDLSETLTPDFCPVDGDGVRVNAFNGTFGEEQYGCYHKWESEKTVKEWDHTGSVSSSEDVPMVTIEALKDTYKQDSYKFQYPNSNKNITTFTLSNILSFMQLTAGYGYHIMGYTFSYTTTKAITDIGGYEGEITCDAAGTHTVDVRGLDAKTVEIAFGNATNETISIYDFYVFVKKGESLTTDYLDYITNQEPFMAFNKAYTIASKGNPNNHLYAPEGKNMLDICGQGCHNNSSVTVTATDPNQQFMLIPFSVPFYSTESVQTGYEDCFFLYNVGQRMFVSKEGKFTLLTKFPRNAVEITAGEEGYEGYFRLSFNKTNLLNVSTGHCTDENSSCVVTNWNTIDNGNNFYIREVRDFREEDGEEMGAIMEEVFHIGDATTVSEMAAKLDGLLQHNSVGYPISTIRESLETVRTNIANGVPSYFFDLEYHINAYKTTTEVNMPVSGNAYRIYAKYANGDKRYLYRTEDGKLRMSDANQEPTGHTGTFILRSTDTAENGQGSYLFAHDSGEYMVYVSDERQGVGNSSTGFVSAYEQGDYDADVKLISTANKTATNYSTITAAGDFFGGFLLQARNTTDNGDFYMMGGDGTDESSINLHQASASSIYYTNIRSSIFYVEEASYPNVANMRCAAYNRDGKSYASIWLPFDIEIPEGVEAYTARIDEANSRLVLDLVEGDYLPAECAAILIGATEEKTTLIPAKVKADVISSNQLKGTNVAGQAPATDKKTFVLNGAKTKGIGFYPYTAANLPTYKAYIEMDAEMAAQGLRFSFATPTGIEETIVEGERETKVYYDLSGRRVAQPTKGLYIVNGKKMYIK